MNNRLFIYVLLSITFSFCKPQKENTDTPPETILSEQQFIELLTDCYLAEGATSINIKNVSAEKFDSVYAFNPVKNKSIRKSQFDSTLVYYCAHPKKLKEIHEKILEHLSEIQANGKLSN